MAMIGKVLRMHRRDKKSVREIALATSLARNTVRKHLRAEGVEERRRYQRPTVPSKLAPFVEAVEQALIVDARRPKMERRTAKALLKQIREAGYDGGYSRAESEALPWPPGCGNIAHHDAGNALSDEASCPRVPAARHGVVARRTNISASDLMAFATRHPAA